MVFSYMRVLYGVGRVILRPIPEPTHGGTFVPVPVPMGEKSPTTGLNGAILARIPATWGFLTSLGVECCRDNLSHLFFCFQK